MSQKSPSFQWYPRDHLTSARAAQMTSCEEGAYLRAICYCWLNGHIPSDIELLRRLIGKGCSEKTAKVVANMFVPMPGDETKLIHERLEAEREKQKAWRDKSLAAGKKSAELRKIK